MQKVRRAGGAREGGFPGATKILAELADSTRAGGRKRLGLIALERVPVRDHTELQDGKGNRKLIEAQTRKILAAGAVPLIFGGDDSIPIPFIAGFSGSSPLTILQIDAHIDWRDERYGEKFGFSSTMRRASEQAHVWRIVQVGARGLGSAREAEVRHAKQWGAHIFTSRHVHHNGLKDILDTIPPRCCARSTPRPASRWST